MHQVDELFVCFAQSIKYPDAEWADFLVEYSGWAGGQTTADDLLHALPLSHIDSALNLFRLDSQLVAAEREFARLCDRHDSIGISAGRFLRYPLLRPHLQWPPENDVDEFLDLGWSQSAIDEVQNATDPTSDINHRMKAAAGRLICMPTFLSDRDAVRRNWESLPKTNRPRLPISHRSTPQVAANQCLVKADEPLATFAHRFGEFCDYWHLLGMADWDRPDVQGPLWAVGLNSDESRTRGAVTVTTPWHFKVLASDGLGPLLEAEHDLHVAERGIDDEDSWQTYATMLEIFHWERVLRRRYGPGQRRRGFVTELQFVLSEMLSLGPDRVKRLRTRLAGLRSGKLRSLRGLR